MLHPDLVALGFAEPTAPSLVDAPRGRKSPRKSGIREVEGKPSSPQPVESTDKNMGTHQAQHTVDTTGSAVPAGGESATLASRARAAGTSTLSVAGHVGAIAGESFIRGFAATLGVASAVAVVSYFGGGSASVGVKPPIA